MAREFWQAQFAHAFMRRRLPAVFKLRILYTTRHTAAFVQESEIENLKSKI